MFKTIKSPAQDDKLCTMIMAHLVISKNISFDRLVSMTSQYLSDLQNSRDVFEQDEINSFLNEIYFFCSLNRGMSYWQRVLTAAKNR